MFLSYLKNCDVDKFIKIFMNKAKQKIKFN